MAKPGRVVLEDGRIHNNWDVMLQNYGHCHLMRRRKFIQPAKADENAAAVHCSRHEHFWGLKQKSSEGPVAWNPASTMLGAANWQSHVH